MNGYIPLENGLYLSLETGLIHHCKTREEREVLARLVRPFEETEKRQAIKVEQPVI